MEKQLVEIFFDNNSCLGTIIRQDNDFILAKTINPVKIDNNESYIITDTTVRTIKPINQKENK